LQWLCAGRSSTAARIERFYSSLLRLEAKLNKQRSRERTRASLSKRSGRQTRSHVDGSAS